MLKGNRIIALALLFVGGVSLFPPYSFSFNLPDTGVTVSVRDGDDGYYNFPDNQPGYVVISTLAVYDRNTGLTWISSPTALPGYQPHYLSNALNFCLSLSTVSGVSGWRLPNIKEMQSIMDYSSIYVFDRSYFSFPIGGLWTSTPYPAYTLYGMFYYTYDGGVGVQSNYNYSDFTCVSGDYKGGTVTLNGFLGQMNFYDVSFWFGVFFGCIIIVGFKAGGMGRG